MSEPAVNATDARPIRVLLVDDHVVVRKGLRALLDREAGIEVAGEAEDGGGWAGGKRLRRASVPRAPR